jgi:hypothetical protein
MDRVNVSFSCSCLAWPTDPIATYLASSFLHQVITEQTRAARRPDRSFPAAASRGPPTRPPPTSPAPSRTRSSPVRREEAAQRARGHG